MDVKLTMENTAKYLFSALGTEFVCEVCKCPHINYHLYVYKMQDANIQNTVRLPE